MNCPVLAPESWSPGWLRIISLGQARALSPYPGAVDRSGPREGTGVRRACRARSLALGSAGLSRTLRNWTVSRPGRGKEGGGAGVGSGGRRPWARNLGRRPPFSFPPRSPPFPAFRSLAFNAPLLAATGRRACTAEGFGEGRRTLPRGGPLRLPFLSCAPCGKKGCARQNRATLLRLLLPLNDKV